ncbi:hypothetical protein EC957_003979 [Mortierella hygrophila]|uniref:beta-glucosidase n=1 Tax=Mortierella hygrophila TaxID=979708 RepID=A0A9P6F1A7_9FUNG|nr:hypothetical protein EC957_003979 [Mortierella hygrophila]
MAVTPAPIGVVPLDNLASSFNNDQQQQQQAIMAAQDAPDYNPQQQPTPDAQLIDQDSYNGRTPQATYRTYDPAMETLSSSASLSEDYDPPGPTTQVDADIQKLAESLTLRELAGQMTQIQIGMLLDKSGELDLGKAEYWIGEWGVGSFLDTPTNHGGKHLAYSAKRFAKIVALSTGKGIPMIYGLDSVHGANYVDGAILFPQQIGLAATFNTTHAYEVGRITAKDTRAAGIPWVFAPILDVAVHKLWPRVYESFGEDPHVASVMGSAVIKGLQGNYKKDRTRVAACMKHFIGYSGSRNGQDKSSAWIPDNYLMDYFVPPFQAAIDAGVATAMETYIDVNGQPVVGSHFYLTELLRNRLGFEGMLVTDWAEVDRLFTEHRSVPSLKDATAQCLKQTSVDMVMVPESESFSKDAVTLVQEGRLDRGRLVESVAKVLQLKKDVGLFEQPLSDPALLPLVGSQQDIEAAKEAVRESVTVLKNEGGVLPLSKKANGKIFVTGPAANSIRALSGGWSIKWQGAEKDEWYQNRGETILEGLRHEFGPRSVSYAPSVDFDGNPIEEGEHGSYLQAATEADTVVLCLGEKPYAEIVGNIDNLDLPWGQLQLILNISQRVRGSNTKIILVLVEGRPRTLQWLPDHVDAIVMAYLPGPWGGHPIAEVLSGTVNPSGRLPITYPRGPSDMGANYYRSGIDPYKPLFPFGAGLSYSTIDYSGLRLNHPELHTTTYEKKDVGDPGDLLEEAKEAVEDEDDDGEEAEAIEEIQMDDDDSNNAAQVVKKSHHHHHQKRDTATTTTIRLRKRPSGSPPASISATIRLKNTSTVPVKETVFWYITQDYRSDIMPEAYMLRGFEKVSLDAGESKDVKFRIRRSALAYHGRNLRKRVEKGSFTLTVNAMRPEAQSIKFNVV